MAATIAIAVYTNSDDAFVAWAPSAFIPGCRGFQLERGRKTERGEQIDLVENRVGFKRDDPQSGEHKPSNEWPFQRFNWTDHAVDVGNMVRYRVTAMIATDTHAPFQAGPASEWTEWAALSADVGQGFSCYFNRGLVLSQFAARYMREHHLKPKAFKEQLAQSVDPVFRAFLAGDLGAEMMRLLADAKKSGTDVHAALYELNDSKLEDSLIALKKQLHLILANGSDKSGDGNEHARDHLHAKHIPTVDRMLKSKGLGHNKFVVLSDGGEANTVWTGSTNWSTTGLCTQINNGLKIVNADVASMYRQQWDLLRDASPPKTKPAGFTEELVASNDEPKDVALGGVNVRIWFTRTSDGSDFAYLQELIAQAKQSILFLMFQPGGDGLHTEAAQRANDPHMYVRGVVSTLGNEAGDSDRDVLEVQLVSEHQTFKPDHYTVVQPQGEGKAFGSWIAEVTRPTFLSQVGHAIVHSKVLVIDALSDDPVVVTGSHNFSLKAASRKNDENLVIIRGHKALARAYATNVMSVYQHYRFRSYVRETLAAGKQPWSYLDDDDHWLKQELKSKSREIAFWTN